MKFLLDTHLLLRAALGTLSIQARTIVLDGDNTLYFSPVSIWEVVIKKNFGRADFDFDPGVLHRSLLENQYRELPVTSRHALAVYGLPEIHRDPFDRILLAQAVTEGIPLLTSDRTLREYPVSVVFVS